jgi:hypothetical protein
MDQTFIIAISLVAGLAGGSLFLSLYNAKKIKDIQALLDTKRADKPAEIRSQ